MKTLWLPAVACLLSLSAPGAEDAAARTLAAPSGPVEVGGMARDVSPGLAALALPSITNARTAKTVPSSGCTPVPAAVSSFSTSDEYVYLFFYINGQANGEQLTRVWWAPNGQVVSSSAWSPMSSGGGYCPWAGLKIAGAEAASYPGTWRVQVFSNMITDVPYVDLTFTITAGGGGGGGGSGLPTVTYARTAKSVPSGLCDSVPTQTTSFLSTDPSVFLYFRIAGFQNGEVLSSVWWDPSGQIYYRGAWGALSGQYSSYCLSDRLDLAGTAAAGKPGTWRVQVYSDKWTDIPFVDLTFTVTASGGGGGGGGGGTVAGTWLLTSAARVQGAGAFWQTDLSVRNTGSSDATVTVKFLGHGADGRGGPERSVTVAAGQTQTWRDILASLFGLSSDYGPILVRSTTSSLAILGQTWTSGGGGTYGQSVPVLSAGELIGATPRSILGVRQDSFFRTNLMLANATESTVSVTVQLVSTGGSVLATKTLSLGPLSRAQYNVGSDFGYTNLADGVFVISSSSSGAQVGAYASVIDGVTADPRTLLPR